MYFCSTHRSVALSVISGFFSNRISICPPSVRRNVDESTFLLDYLRSRSRGSCYTRHTRVISGTAYFTEDFIPDRSPSVSYIDSVYARLSSTVISRRWMHLSRVVPQPPTSRQNVGCSSCKRLAPIAMYKDDKNLKLRGNRSRHVYPLGRNAGLQPPQEQQ